MAIGTVLIDSDTVRVTRWQILPGDHIPRHRHELPYVVVGLTDAQMHVVDAAGSESVTQLEPGTSYERPAGVEHTVTNRGDGDVIFVEVELKSSDR